MISESELMELNFPGAPKMVTEVPGPKVLAHLEESAKYESLTRGGGGWPVVMSEGKGVTVKDPDGNLYIDMAAGVAVSAVGRGHPKVLEAIRRQCDVIMHTTDTTNPKRLELAKKVSSVMPEGLAGKCHTAVYQAGSDATETAVKWARAYTGKQQIVAFHGAYHGVWYGTAALTTAYNYRHGWGPQLSGAIHLAYPYCYRCAFGMQYPDCDLQCAKYVDYVMNTPYTGADDVAAVMIESQQGEGGYCPPPPEFLSAVKAACDKYGCLYIADEVQSGAGRTGKMWAIQHSDVVPDILTWGKGMGGDIAMAGVTYRADIEDALREGSQPSTFAGNGVACEVSLTNISMLTDPQMGLIERAAQVGEEIKGKVRDAMDTCACIGDVRGNGFMIGIELVANRETREPIAPETVGEVAMKLLNRGVQITPCGRYGNVFRVMPPLTAPREYVDKALEIMFDVFSGYGDKVKPLAVSGAAVD
jgi:4-aminobutyrate aminotransferase